MPQKAAWSRQTVAVAINGRQLLLFTMLARSVCDSLQPDIKLVTIVVEGVEDVYRCIKAEMLL